MTVITRFAPSPTGYLHIGGARTALFNWLFAKHMGGTFLLRIEDTDRARSTDAAVDAILNGMRWLGLDWDGEPVFQFARMNRHAEIAQQLLTEGKAYYCYCTPEELDEMRTKAQAEGRPPVYDRRWRDRDASEAPAGAKPVIRIKAPLTGTTTVNDVVQGEVTLENTQLDDMVLLRADGTPTYMLSVVVDDHDMDITHVIRGDDHFVNTFRQRMIYDAMGWDVPTFAHIPMILGPDGAKLSKRHGSPAVEAYRDMGYTAEAMRNYLLRLGWGHGDTEIVSTEEAIKIFTLEGIGRSPSRLDFDKLNNVSAHYIRAMDETELTEATYSIIINTLNTELNPKSKEWLRSLIGLLKERAKTLIELASYSSFLFKIGPSIDLDEDAQTVLDADARNNIKKITEVIEKINNFNSNEIEAALKQFAADNGLKMGKVGMPFRAAITGTTHTPSIFKIAEVMGKNEVLARLRNLKN